MGRIRVRLALASIGIAGGLVLTLRGQVANQTPLQILQSVGVAAIDEGLLQDESHSPSAAETRQRAALRTSLFGDRVASTGTRYRAGRVIVKFRDEAAMPDRNAAVRAASGT